MISASAADAHRFGRVKRNGYDPAEVDAVVARLVEAIRKYETKTEDLEQRLSEADASADAIRRTFMAAEETADKMLSEARSEALGIHESARTEAEQIRSNARSEAANAVTEARDEAETVRADARSEAERIVTAARNEADRIEGEARASAERTAELASQVDSEVAAHRDRILAEAHDHAELLMVDAELSAAERAATSTAEAEEALDIATRNAERTRRIAVASLRASMIAAARIRTAASAAAADMVEAAEATAYEISSEAETRAAEAEERADHLKRAIAGLDEAAKQLAQVTAEGISVIDLSRIEANEAEIVPDVEAHEPTTDKWATRSAPPTTDVHEDAAVDLEDADADEHEEVDGEEKPHGSFYQRSTGTPLSERVKIARRSG